jgi:drug/metabolite transporter (DMT)-like permease
MTAQPHLTTLIVAAVIAAGALHAVWNAIAKDLDDRLMVFAMMGIPVTVVVPLAFGLMSLALSAGTLTRSELPAIALAALTGLAIASYTVVDGLGVRAAQDPFAYAGLMFALQGPVFPLVALFRRPAARWRDRTVLGRGLLAGALSVLAYGIVLWAQARAPLAEVAAIRETSVIFAALIGMIFLKERFGVRRVAAAVVIAAGIVLIST